MIELEVASGVAEGQLVKTNAPSISIGRSPEHTIVISDPSVSRHHGEIVLLKNHYQYRDLNSTHGTMLRRNDERNFVKQVVLREGDELILGPTDNVIRVMKVKMDPIDSDKISVTMMHQSADFFAPPELIFAHDSKALHTIVHLDTRLMDSSITTERHVLDELLEHIPELFEALTYVAIIEEYEGGVRPYDHRIIQEAVSVRLSGNLIQKAAKANRAFLFRIRKEGTLETNKEKVALSSGSLLVNTKNPKAMTDTTGICAPLSGKPGQRKYLQFERYVSDGLLTEDDVTLVRSMAMRVVDRIDNLELVRQNQMLNLNATLGVFAGMIGHDIKNYLFFGKKLSEIRDDPLSKHPGIIRGIERGRKLAQGMKDLAAPGNVILKTFSVEDMAHSVANEFSSLFGDACDFEVVVSGEPPQITTSEDLLYRVVWNLVMNAYHTAENKRSMLQEPPHVRIWLCETAGGDVVIEVRDNAGGIGPRTLEYMQRSFALIHSVHNHEEDLINVVNTINKMEGFTNSVGLFFTAVAVNDMSGEIKVSTTPKTGSVFRIKLPKEIKELRRLLRF